MKSRINAELLFSIIEKSEITCSSLASLLGVSYYVLCNKIFSKSDFKVSEIRKICNLLNISDGQRELIFFN